MVKAKAYEKQIRIEIFTFPCGCHIGRLKPRAADPTDQLSVDIAASTEGVNRYTILRLEDTVTLIKSCSDGVHVDSYMTGFSPSLLGERTNATVKMSDSLAIPAADIMRIELANRIHVKAKVGSIKSPYRVTITGNGTFPLITQADSPIQMSFFRFATGRAPVPPARLRAALCRWAGTGLWGGWPAKENEILLPASRAEGAVSRIRQGPRRQEGHVPGGA